MYRIIFDSQKAQWVVELLSWTLLWRRVNGKSYETLAQAEAYVTEVGLDDAYRRQPTMRRDAPNMQIHLQPPPQYQYEEAPQPQPYVVRSRRAV
jgi:hypothetical protein